MCSIFNMHVLAYLLSLSLSLEASLDFLKSMNTSVPDPNVKLNHAFTTEAYGIESTRSDLITRRYLDNRPRADVAAHDKLHKAEDIGLQRRKNRTRHRKQRKSHPERKPDEIKTITGDIYYDADNIQQKNDRIAEKSVDTTQQLENDSGFPSVNLQSTNSLQTTLKPSERTIHHTALTTKSTTKSNLYEQHAMRRKNHKAIYEGRSRNRPHRNHNRRKNPSALHRRRNRPSSSSSRHHQKHRILLDRRNKHIQSSPIESPSNHVISNGSSGYIHNSNSTVFDKEGAGPSEDAIREIRLQMFIKTLADKLRMTPEDLMARRSRRRSALILPPAFLEGTLQDNAKQREEDNFYAKDERVIIPGRDLGKKKCVAKRPSGCYSFKLAENVKGQVASAELWLYKMPDSNDAVEHTYKIYRLERQPSGQALARNQIQEHTSYVKEGWVVISLTRTVAAWVRERKAMEMIAIRCASCATRSYKALYGVKDGYTPLIVINYDKTSLNFRERRSTDEDCNPEVECCKRRLDINFEEIYMYSIQAPPELSVGYCYGSCNAIHQYDSEHTMIKQKIRNQGEEITEDLREQLKPCCVPISYTLQTFVLRRSMASSPIQTIVPDVVVDQCGCV